MADTCYMCDAEATTDEHAPPQCLFPETKAFKEMGIDVGDLRKNLITVRSCAEHNNKKSNDDVFLRNVLVMNQGTNNVGQNQLIVKVLKAFKRDPTLLAQFKIDPNPVVIVDDKGPFETNAMTADIGRFNSALDKMGRALYFHYFNGQKKWVGKIKVVNEFMHVTGGAEADEENKYTEFLRSGTPRFFATVPEHGENKEVFTFQVLAVEVVDALIMRLRFYGNAVVFLVFHNRS